MLEAEQKIEPAPGVTPGAAPEEKLRYNPEPMLVSNSLLEKAEEVCRRRLANDPDNRAVLLSLAQVCRKRGNLSEATELYRRLTILNPLDKEAEYTHAVLAGIDVPTGHSGIRPAPFVFIKDFLPQSVHERLLPFALSVEQLLVPALVGANPHYNPNTRESLDLPGKWPIKSFFRSGLRKLVPRLLPRLHTDSFEIGELEVKLRAYLDGHFFRIHMDSHPEEEICKYRRVSYVYFFHKVPRAYTGGELLLFDTDVSVDQFTTASFTRIVPEDNCIVFFPSAYWHSVVPVGCPSKKFEDSRFVINGHISQRAPNAAVEAEGEPTDTEADAEPTAAEAEAELTAIEAQAEPIVTEQEAVAELPPLR
jgi:hypothetical protein